MKNEEVIGRYMKNKEETPLKRSIINSLIAFPVITKFRVLSSSYIEISFAHVFCPPRKTKMRTPCA